MKKKYSVLVVDDAFFIRNLIKRAIGNKPSSDYPYEFEIAGEGLNGEEGLLLYKALRPDIVTVDVNMGSLGGVAFIKKLRAFDKDAQVIVISSSLDNNLKAEISNLGCYYIQKPFQEAYLWTKLDTIAEYLMSKPKKVAQPKKVEPSKPVVTEVPNKKVSEVKVEATAPKKVANESEVANKEAPKAKATPKVKTEPKKDINKTKANKQQNNNQKKNQPNKNKQKKKHLLDDDNSLVTEIPQELLKNYKDKSNKQNSNANKPNPNKGNKQHKPKTQSNKPKAKEVKNPIDDFVVEEGLSINAMRDKLKQNTTKSESKKTIKEVKEPVVKMPVIEVIEEVVVPVQKEPVVEVVKQEIVKPVKTEQVKEIIEELEPTKKDEPIETLDIIEDEILEIVEDDVLEIVEDEELTIEDNSVNIVDKEDDLLTIEDDLLTIEDDSDLIIVDETSSDEEILLIDDSDVEDTETLTIEDDVLEIIDEEENSLNIDEKLTIEDDSFDITDEEDEYEGGLVLAYEEDDIPISLNVQKDIVEDELEEDTMLTDNIQYEGHYQDEDEELDLEEEEEVLNIEEPSIEETEELSIEHRLLEDISYDMAELLSKVVDENIYSKEELQISILNDIAKDLNKPIVENKHVLSVEEELGIEDEEEVVHYDDDDDFDFDDFKDIEFSLDTGSYAEELPIKNENMYYQTDNTPKTELNTYTPNYNTVNNESSHSLSGGVKIAPPKDARLKEIYSAKMEKDYNIVFDEGKVEEPTEPVKKDGLFSKLFNKKKKNK